LVVRFADFLQGIDRPPSPLYRPYYRHDYRNPLRLDSVQRGGKVEIIANDQGNRITPSWVGFTHDERLIGDAAKNQGPSNPENTVFDAKRLIGRNFIDSDVQKDIKHWSVSNGGRPASLAMGGRVLLIRDTQAFQDCQP